jgi:hypothetical protein
MIVSCSESVLFLVSSRGVLPKAHSWGADSQASVQKRYSSGAAWSEVTANWGLELVADVHRNWEDFLFFPSSVSTLRGSSGKS